LSSTGSTWPLSLLKRTRKSAGWLKPCRHTRRCSACPGCAECRGADRVRGRSTPGDSRPSPFPGLADRRRCGRAGPEAPGYAARALAGRALLEVPVQRRFPQRVLLHHARQGTRIQCGDRAASGPAWISRCGHRPICAAAGAGAHSLLRVWLLLRSRERARCRPSTPPVL